MTYPSIVKRACALVALLASGVMPASSQELSPQLKVGDVVVQHFGVPLRDGEFRHSSAPGLQGIACTIAAKPGVPPPQGPDYSYCLKVGSLQIGMEFYRLQIALSQLNTIASENIINPRIVDTTPNGIRTVVIPIATVPTDAGTRMQSYLVATLDASGFVQALQLTGLPGDTSTALPFSGITLGTTKERVLDVLGNPSSVSDVPKIQGRLWSYAPFPFTFEFTKDQVYSIRINRPAEGDYSKVFTPLRSMSD